MEILRRPCLFQTLRKVYFRWVFKQQPESVQWCRGIAGGNNMAKCTEMKKKVYSERYTESNFHIERGKGVKAEEGSITKVHLGFAKESGFCCDL